MLAVTSDTQPLLASKVSFEAAKKINVVKEAAGATAQRPTGLMGVPG